MPELPDVETFGRYVAATSLHQRIECIDVDAPRMLKGVSPEMLERRLEGQRFRSTRRHGKYLFIEIDGNGWLLLHFGMTGYLDYGKEQNALPTHSRLVVHFANGYRLAGIWQRRLGRIGLAQSPAKFIEDEGLGPDALEPGIALEDFKAMLHGRRGSIKSALMDQSFIAGIGNIYSDEMLFQAEIHPGKDARTLDDDQLARLHAKMLHVLNTAIDRQADPERLPKSWLLPHREDGEKCPRCNGTVKSLRISGRTAYLCPTCQSAG